MQDHKAYTTPGLRPWRRRAGLTLAEVSASTGVSRAHLSRIERGQRRVSLGTLLLISQALGCRVGADLDSVVDAILDSTDAPHNDHDPAANRTVGKVADDAAVSTS